MTTIESDRVAAALLLSALVLLVPLFALEDGAPVPSCTSEACASPAAPVAQKKKARAETVLDKVGLGSLRDVAWEALPAALALSALIGAAGGFVYAGIVGGSRSVKKPADQESDRTSS